MKYPKLRELKEAIKALIKGPYTSRFPFQPHQPYERFRGRPEYHQDDCMGCGACFQVCPAKAIEMNDARGKRTLTVHWDLCIFCGQCQMSCPTEKGIILSREFDLATTGKREELKQSVEKEFILCECCNEPVLPYEQYLWVAKKLGPLSYSNPSLILFYSRLLFAVPESKPAALRKEDALVRADRIRILCPRCRREAVINS